MKKSEQLAINQQVLAFLEAFRNSTRPMTYETSRPLRGCSARVNYMTDTETGEILYAVLTSYSTVVAVIDYATDTLYDFLRYVYGYTTTSAQHISKFDKDYGKSKWGCTRRLTYKEVN
jgi:hypothetical protein